MMHEIFNSQPAINTDLAIRLKEGAFLVDVREPFEFEEAQVKGSVNIPLGQLQDQLPLLKEKKSIVVFCQSGSRSSIAKQILVSNGINNVVNGLTWRNVSKFVDSANP